MTWYYTDRIFGGIPNRWAQFWFSGVAEGVAHVYADVVIWLMPNVLPAPAAVAPLPPPTTTTTATTTTSVEGGQAEPTEEATNEATEEVDTQETMEWAGTQEPRGSLQWVGIGGSQGLSRGVNANPQESYQRIPWGVQHEGVYVSHLIQKRILLYQNPRYTQTPHPPAPTPAFGKPSGLPPHGVSIDPPRGSARGTTKEPLDVPKHTLPQPLQLRDPQPRDPSGRSGCAESGSVALPAPHGDLPQRPSPDDPQGHHPGIPLWGSP